MEAWSGSEKWRDNENNRKGKGMEQHECVTERRERMELREEKKD